MGLGTSTIFVAVDVMEDTGFGLDIKWNNGKKGS